MSWQTIRRAVAPLALTLTLAAGGCAAAGTGSGGAGNIEVEVENNLIPPTSLSIFATTDTGVRRLVGVAGPSRTVTLSFDPSGVSGRFVFEAVTTSGQSINSQPISISEGERVSWDVSANLMLSVNR